MTTPLMTSNAYLGACSASSLATKSDGTCTLSESVANLKLNATCSKLTSDPTKITVTSATGGNVSLPAPTVGTVTYAYEVDGYMMPFIAFTENKVVPTVSAGTWAFSLNHIFVVSFGKLGANTDFTGWATMGNYTLTNGTLSLNRYKADGAFLSNPNFPMSTTGCSNGLLETTNSGDLTRFYFTQNGGAIFYRDSTNSSPMTNGGSTENNFMLPTTNDVSSLAGLDGNYVGFVTTSRGNGNYTTTPVSVTAANGAFSLSARSRLSDILCPRPTLVGLAGVVALVCGLPAQAADADANVCNTPAFNWQKHNRFIGIEAVNIAQNYREQDTQGLTPDGVLNSETGTWRGTALQARWQGQLGAVPLWLQAQAVQASGQTAYNGYLQSGNTLTPYRALTGNTLQQTSVRVGLPIAVPVTIPADEPALQLVPYVEWANRVWQRNLVQYSETYTHTTHSLGLLAQWRMFANHPQWVLEAGYQQGYQQSATLSAPSLGFAADLGAGVQTQSSLALHYRPMPAWSLYLQATQIDCTNGASPVVNGLQAPPSTKSQNTVGAGMVWNY